MTVEPTRSGDSTATSARSRPRRSAHAPRRSAVAGDVNTFAANAWLDCEASCCSSASGRKINSSINCILLNFPIFRQSVSLCNFSPCEFNLHFNNKFIEPLCFRSTDRTECGAAPPRPDTFAGAAGRGKPLLQKQSDHSETKDTPCGIVGAVASRNITPILVEGLKRLEYRGYDSCGVAVHADGALKRRAASAAWPSWRAR